jgi:beta-N-acetylhexosaminidase
MFLLPARHRPGQVRTRPGRASPTASNLLVPALLMGLAAGCGDAPTATSASTTAPPPTREAVTPTTTLVPPSHASPTTRSRQATTGCPQRTLAAMSARQRAGQVFIVGVATTTTSAKSAGIALATSSYAGGYLLYGGTEAPLTGVRKLTDDVSGRLAAEANGVRPFVAADQEGGQIQPLSGPGFAAIPPALVQGTWSVDRLRTAARSWGEQLRRAGVNVDFAPVVDVVPASLGTANGPIGRYQRELGHTSDVVSAHAVAVVQGLQSAGIAATAKHFPGLGRVIDNPDTAAGVRDPVTTSDDPALRPYAAVIAAGARFVMVSSASYPRIDPNRLAVFSPKAMAQLRGPLRFSGLIVSDDLGAARQVATIPAARRAVDFLTAGGQVIVAVKPARVVAAMVRAVVTAMGTDPTFRAKVDAAALAVLTTKQALGLLRC